MTILEDLHVEHFCPRPCWECADRLHHWLDQCDEDSLPHYVCKHCEAVAAACDDCLEPIFPVPPGGIEAEHVCADGCPTEEA